MTEQSAADPGAADPGAADPGLAAERDRLARLLRETRLQLTMTQARLAALEQSATLELGRALVGAARRPWPRATRLPRDLYRMWRSGGARQAAPGTSAAQLALASAQLGDIAGGGERLLAALTAPGLAGRGDAAAPGLVVTGVLTAEACAVLGPDAAVQPLLPHDADVVLESSGADLVIIEAAAVLAGSAWAYAADPAGADRGRRLARVIAGARALGKPVIFVRNIPAHLAPGLDWVAASCDAVADDGLGVQLALFNPIGITAARGREPVSVGDEISWRRRPALYREHALFVAGSAAQAREQLACGARVISAVRDPGDLPSLIAAATAAGPPDWPEILTALRQIFGAHATAARLAALAGQAGLPDGLVTGRQIAVAAAAADVGAATALAGVLSRQRLIPAEVVLCSAADDAVRRAVGAALGDLAARGVQIKVIKRPNGVTCIGACAAMARSPWIAPMDPWREYADEYLLDLACARECSRADAVGLGGAAYQFTTAIQPGLARRELLGAGTTLHISHGLRLFSAS